jgi:hypothetical protein
LPRAPSPGSPALGAWPASAAASSASARAFARARRGMSVVSRLAVHRPRATAL